MAFGSVVVCWLGDEGESGARRMVVGVGPDCSIIETVPTQEGLERKQKICSDDRY
jgi:hypothetical protein